MTNERYEVLIDRFLEGDLTELELHEFGTLLKQDQRLARDASERLAEHRLLGLLHQPFDSKAFADSVLNAVAGADANEADDIFSKSVGANKKDIQAQASSNRAWRSGVYFLLAVVLFAVSLFVVQNVINENGNRESLVPGPIVATLLLAEDCRWRTPPRVEGERLPTGPLGLKTGLLVIRFDGGAELVLQGDCSLVLLSAGGVQVDRGNVIVRASDEATGFRVETPSSELIDLGTEFSVSVGGNGETKLNVLEGEVSIRPLKNQVAKPQLLGEGNSVIVKTATSNPEKATHDNLRFATVIRNANLRSRADLRFAYEGFFYDEGELPLSESTKGIGWQGPWRKRTIEEGYRADQDTTDSLDIVHGQMNVTWGIRGGELGMLKMPAGFTVRLRKMTQSIKLDADEIYYISMMVREPDHSKRAPNERPRESVRLTLRSSDAYLGESVSFGVSHQLKPRIATGQGVGFVSSSKAPTDQTTLWIGKIVARANGEDEVYFRIFGEDDELVSDELSWAEPSQWHVVSRNLDLSASLDLVVLTSEGVAPRYIDELRIGPTWRSVAPLKP